MQLSVLTSYFRILTTFKWNNSTSFPLALRTSSIWRWNAQHKIGNPDSSNKPISRAGPFPVLLGLESTENRPRTSIDIHKKWIMIIIIPSNYLFFVRILREKNMTYWLFPPPHSCGWCLSMLWIHKSYRILFHELMQIGLFAWRRLSLDPKFLNQIGILGWKMCYSLQSRSDFQQKSSFRPVWNVV